MQKDSAGEERNPAVPRVYKHGYKNVSVWRLKQSDFNAEIQKDNKKRPRVSSQHVLYPTLSVNYLLYLECHSCVLLILIHRTPTLHPSASSILNKTHLDLYHVPCVPRDKHMIAMNACV